MKPNCQIPDCPKPADAHELCGRHYRREIRGTAARRYPIPVGPGPWVEQGACRGQDPEFWFPITERPPASDVALATCRRCPVLDECRDWAIDNQPYGIAGGLTTSQRDTRRRNRKATTTAGVR